MPVLPIPPPPASVLARRVPCSSAAPRSGPPARFLPAAVALGGAWLVIAWTCLPDFGLSWDCAELHVGDQTAGFVRDLASGHDFAAAEPLRHAAPAPRLPTDAPWTHSNVPAALLAAATCWLGWDVLGWTTATSGYLVATTLWVAVLAAAVATFGERHCGRGAGLLGAVLLLLMPRFATEAIANFKDTPECACFAFAVLAGFAALRSGSVRAWTACGALAGVAAAMRPNGLFVPFVLAPFALAAWQWPARAAPLRRPSWHALAAAALAAGVAAIAVLPPAWIDPVRALGDRFAVYTALGRDASAPIAFDSLWHAYATAPPLLLAAAAVGLLSARVPRSTRAFLGVWLAVPLLRTALPGMRHYDGIRHFLEFTVPLALLAGTGLAAAGAGLRRRWPRARWLALVLALLPIGESAWALARVYPYGTCWFSPLVGGLRGAQQRGVAEATDYWCTSYWAACAWLAAHAEPDARVICPVAPHVLAATVPVRWRADLALATAAADLGAARVYIVYATRPELYPRWLCEARARHAPVHAIAVQGGTILEILELGGGDASLASWRRQLRAEALGLELLAELQQRDAAAAAALWSVFVGAAARGEAASVAQLRALFPARSVDELALALWPHLPAR